MDELHDYLNAYVARRGQVLQLKNTTEDVTTKSNDAYDFCHITYKSDSSKHEFILNYVLDKSLPTKVEVKVKTKNNTKKRKHIKKFEDLFMKMEILDAFNLYIDEGKLHDK